MTNHQPILNGDADDNRQPMQDVHMAARYGNAETVQRLVVEIGQSATSRRGSIGSTPAHDAAATGNLATLTWLLTETGDMPYAHCFFFFF
jgi:ankyrin repeat protein